MLVHQDIEQLPAFRKCVLTIGTFDGVHLGHREIITQLKTEAVRLNGETVIITFHPHPRKIINSAKPPIHLINTIDEKIELLDQLGVDHLVVVPFDERFSQMSAQHYVEHFLMEKFRPHTIIIGYDHHFGQGRTGDYLMLEEYSSKLGFQLIEISPRIISENAVSSTRIREALTQGDITAANGLLGYDFFFQGKVIGGNKLGRTLGYPTANIEIADEEKLVPANGIYVVEVSRAEMSVSATNTRDDLNAAKIRIHPERLKGMMSIGIRPTLPDGIFMIEVNIFDFDEEIYDQTLRVFVKKYLRPEIKFDGLETLKEQLARDKNDTLDFFKA